MRGRPVRVVAIEEGTRLHIVSFFYYVQCVTNVLYFSTTGQVRFKPDFTGTLGK